MDYVAKLARLEHLKGLVDQYSSEGLPVDDKRRIHREICETYGEVADLFGEVVGRQDIQVPPGGRLGSRYPNYFEAG